MTMRTPIILAIAVHASSAAAETKRPTGCEILEHGVYRPTGTRVHVPDAGDPTGRRSEITEIEFTHHTSTITRRLRLGFGIRYQLYNLPTDRTFRVQLRTHFPRPGLRGKLRSDYAERKSTADGRLNNFMTYDFEFDWEMVAGDWRFEVLVDGRSACSHTFAVK